MIICILCYIPKKIVLKMITPVMKNISTISTKYHTYIGINMFNKKRLNCKDQLLNCKFIH